MGKARSTDLHLVVACADRKSVTAGAPLRLGSVRAPSLDERCKLWWQQLAKASASCAARDLYVGDHWAIARALPDVARNSGFRPRLWVASAGYGLVPAEAMLASYSATFADRSPDSVALWPHAAPGAWWRALARHRLPGSTAPRRLAELVAESRRQSVFLVVVSAPYLVALQEDLVKAAASCTTTQQLMIVTSHPGPSAPSLRDRWVPASARLRLVLGGALPSLHVRVARYLLEGLSPTNFEPQFARQRIDRLLARTPRLPQLERVRLSDTKLRSWIRKELANDAAASHTQLLRRLRTGGTACEQSRFRDLFTIEARRGK